MFNISPAPAAFAKRASKTLSSAKVMFALASTARLGFERLEPAAVIGHVRPVHRAQRHTHRFSNRRLRHPAFTQQHHLNALAPLRISVPAQPQFAPWPELRASRAGSRRMEAVLHIARIDRRYVVVRESHSKPLIVALLRLSRAWKGGKPPTPAAGISRSIASQQVPAQGPHRATGACESGAITAKADALATLLNPFRTRADKVRRPNQHLHALRRMPVAHELLLAVARKLISMIAEQGRSTACASSARVWLHNTSLSGSATVPGGENWQY